MKTKRPFFIVGSPRSGTTLLQAMLMSIPGVYIPPETKFWPITAGRERAYGPITSDRGFELAVRDVLESCPQNELPADVTELEAELRACERTHEALFDTLMAHMQARREECQRIGEKSPPHLPYVPRLLAMYPDGKAITIIRDGRDVAVSQSRAWASNILRTAIGWRRDQRMHASFAERFPADRYTSVRYEDLVTQPEIELRRLCAFLDEPFTEALLEHHKRADSGFAARETHKARTMEPVTTSRIGRYATRLSRSEISLFQTIAGRELRAHGYELDRIPKVMCLAAALRSLPATLRTHAGRQRMIRRKAGS
ncbi:MAG: sulfotransferase [Phycisphaerales bacterium]|nr:sulfotransferase [Phycisphaerales bacterium]